MAKYTEVRKELGLSKVRFYKEKHAYITHLLQSPEDYNPVNYFERIREIEASKELDTVNEFNYKLPLKYSGIPFPPPKRTRFRFIDLFAGIGGFRIALQKQGGKCVFSSEIDNAARKTYEINFGEVPFGDIRFFTGEGISDEKLVSLIPDHDVLAAGFPCQPFSRAGVSARNSLNRSHGFEDEDQGNLFFDIMRIVDLKRPQVLFLENVKNLKSHDGGRTFKVIEKMIRDLGYSFDFEIINAQYLVPQKRERTYMVCFLDNETNFSFPEINGKPKALRRYLEKNVPDDYTISDKLWAGHQARSKRNKERGTGFTVKVAELDKPSNTIVARYYKDGKECLIPQEEGKNPRKLTKRECARLQGFPESFELPDSKNATYKQFGNSVAVPVIEKIAEKIIEKLIQ